SVEGTSPFGDKTPSVGPAGTSFATACEGPHDPGAEGARHALNEAHLYRPRSIVRLILIGFVVVLAPLIVAVLTAVVQVDQLATESEQAVLEAETATQQSRSLVEQLTQMQRALGQYRVLDD